MPKEKTPKTPEEEEEARRRMVRLALGILADNTFSYCVGFTTVDQDWFYEASSKTFGLGASKRILLELEELTKRDAKDGGTNAE